MTPFNVWLIGLAGTFLLVISFIWFDSFPHPFLAYAVRAFGILVFIAGWIYGIIIKARRVQQAVPQIWRAFQKASKEAKTRGYRRKLREEMFIKRYKNFWFSLLFTVVAVGFLMFGVYGGQLGFRSEFHRLVLIVVASVLLLVGLVTTIQNIILIRRGRKQDAR